MQALRFIVAVPRQKRWRRLEWALVFSLAFCISTSTIAEVFSPWLPRARLSTSVSLNSVTFGGGVFVAVGTDIQTSSTVSPIILRSTDATNWSRQTIQGENSLVDVAFGDGTFVAVGGSSPLYRNFPFKAIYSSKDGVSWAQQFEDPSGLLKSIVWGNGRFVAVGDRGYLMSSRDGVEWDQRLTPATCDLVSVTFGNGSFVAVGNTQRITGLNFSSFAVIYSSSDGVNWTLCNDRAGQILGAAFGNGTFAAVHRDAPFRNSTLTSTDGIIWSPHVIGRGAPDIGGVNAAAQYVSGWFIARFGTYWDGSNLQDNDTRISNDLLNWNSIVIPGGKIAQNEKTVVTVGGQTIWQAEILQRPSLLFISSSPFASESGSDVGAFTIRRTGSLAAALSVTVSIGGTAENGVDYEPIARAFVIEAGRESVTIPIRARADAIQEGVETVTLTIEPGESFEGGMTASVSIGESSTVPRFRPARLSRSSGGTFNLTVELPPQGTFQIEASSDLKRWQPIQTVTSGADTIEIRDASAAGQTQRFYRARVLPP